MITVCVIDRKEGLMRKIGLLINPIAGMGGKVGLKGTDGFDVLELAIERGAIPESNDKAVKALEKLLPLKEELLFLTASGLMGENALRKVGLDYEVVHSVSALTEQKDSLDVLERFKEEEVDFILFVGGDGTARDVASVVGLDIPVIGVPAGVKIHSPVYAISPEGAGSLVYKYLSDGFLSLVEMEVIDIEEEAFRQDEIITRLYNYLTVPQDDLLLQSLKSPSPQSEGEAQISIALQIIDDMVEGCYYIIGSGTTPSRILEELNLPPTILGVDIVKDEQLIAKDVNEQEILDIIGDHPTKLIVTPIGGQGYIFGRGNQQLSDRVLNKIDQEDLIIVSTPGKLRALKKKPLLIYTGNEEVDQKLSGYYRVVVGYESYSVYEVESPN